MCFPHEDEAFSSRSSSLRNLFAGWPVRSERLMAALADAERMRSWAIPPSGSKE